MTASPTPTKVLATIGTGRLAPVLDVALPRMRAFAERHGYDVVVGAGDSGGRPPAWSKIPLLRTLVDGYDRVLWVDADALILDLEQDLPPLPEGHVQAMVAHHVEGEQVPNTGFWLLRGGTMGATYLDDVWAREQWLEHPWWEQAAVLDAMGYINVARDSNVLTPETPCQPGPPSEWRDRTTYLPDEWNVLYHHLHFITVKPKVLHYAYMGGPDRVHNMKLALVRSRLESPETGAVAKAALRAKQWSVTGDLPIKLARSRLGRGAVRVAHQIQRRG